MKIPAFISLQLQRLGELMGRNAAEAFVAISMSMVRAGFRHPVRSMQTVRDYPCPGPRRSRFTGIAAMRREARKDRNRRASA